MKMQNEIRAPRDGVVKAVRVRPGQSVEQNQILVVLG
jgi:biotin carboxyl carrier protein